MVEMIIDYNIENDLNYLNQIQQYVECLELRLALIGQNKSCKTEYEKNEDDILSIKTQMELSKYRAIVHQKSFDIIDNLKTLEREHHGGGRDLCGST
jgi:hypothetical protein